jgi:signal transduction histidine kinase
VERRTGEHQACHRSDPGATVMTPSTVALTRTWSGTATTALGLMLAALGTLAPYVAWVSPGTAFLVDQPMAAALYLAAGWGLIAVGLESRRQARRSRFGTLLVIAGAGWFLTEWGNPAIGASWAFTAGLVAGWLVPAFTAHALLVLVREPGRLIPIDRFVLGVGYIATGGLLGMIPALTFRANAALCALCPADLVGLVDAPNVRAASTAVGAVLGSAWVVVMVTLLLVWLAREAPARRAIHAPVVLPGAVLLGAIGLELAGGIGRSVIPIDDTAYALRVAGSVALIGMAVGVGLEWLQVRRARTRVARVVADLGASPKFDGLRETLATTLEDPGLVIGYPLADGLLVDAQGGAVPLETGQGRQATQIVRDGAVVAVLLHRRDVLDAPARVDEVVRAARLGLDHERLQAERRAQLEDLRAARKRIVSTSNEARIGLERDLHDGAQQHLIVLSLGLQLLASQDGPDRAIPEYDEVRRDLRLALDDLRAVAHGIHPNVLSDEGFGAAVEGLVELGSTRIDVDGVPAGRFPADVEAVAYEVVAGAAHAGAPTRVRGERIGSDLVVEVVTKPLPDDVLTDLADRVGAIGGELHIQRHGTTMTMRAVMPCAS